ncbi:MAG TPA: C4-type zinc ribbon domain-containing protein [Thermoanaerobaculia bacterium]|nr:C4-type zinc ribbon domain-containing protein [Thermoanaerobaculia bacterium]
MAQYLDNILELQQALIDLKAADQRLHGIPDWMRELHDEHVARQAEITALEEAAEVAARERRTAEAATADAQEKLKKYQQQINKVSTQREYGALLQEIDTAKAQITASEEQALSLLERFEQTQKDLAEKRESFKDVEARYNAELARWEGEKPAVTAQVQQLNGRIAALKERLPKGLVAQYERIRERHPNGALARIRLLERPGGRGPREWHCGACNYRVRPQVVVEIRNGSSLVQCDACKRILFFPAEEETA